jgi:hypothetical protein
LSLFSWFLVLLLSFSLLNIVSTLLPWLFLFMDSDKETFYTIILHITSDLLYFYNTIRANALTTTN